MFFSLFKTSHAVCPGSVLCFTKAEKKKKKTDRTKMRNNLKIIGQKSDFISLVNACV